MTARMIFAAAAALSMLAGGSAIAAGQAESKPVEAPATASDAKPEKKPEMICRRREDPADVGTRIRSTGKRVCMTKADWDEERRRSQEAVKEMREGVAATAVVGPGGGSGG